MPGNHLEQLVAEWYQWRGYFVRRNARVGPRSKGGHECELDIVAFHPVEQKLVHVETSLDAEGWSQREKRCSKKFEAGRKYIATLFDGLSLPPMPEQIALFTMGGNRSSICGARIVFIKDFMREILAEVRTRRVEKKAIPEEFALLRTLQFAAQYWPLGS